MTGADSTLSTAYRTLLQEAAATKSGGNTSISLTINGLGVGKSYLFEWWSNKSDTALGNGTLTTAGGFALNANTTNSGGGRGQFQVGTFLADSTKQNITFTGVGTNTGFGAILNGFELRQVAPAPEPGTWGMGVALLVAVAASLLRRKSSQRL